MSNSFNVDTLFTKYLTFKTALYNVENPVNVESDKVDEVMTQAYELIETIPSLLLQYQYFLRDKQEMNHKDVALSVTAIRNLVARSVDQEVEIAILEAHIEYLEDVLANFGVEVF